MTTEQDLRDELALRAETFEVPEYDVGLLRAGAARRRTRSRVRSSLVVAAAVVATGAVWQVLPTTQEPEATVDADVRDVVTSCLFPGATPAIPSSQWTSDGYVADERWAMAGDRKGRACTLVLRLGYHRFGLGAGRSGMLWLYSDGRLITETDGDHFVQHQRVLTASGVERVRSLVASHLGAPDADPTPGEETVVWHRGLQYTPDDHALVERLEDLSWLTVEDWERGQRSVYRASWYLLCHEQDDLDMVRALRTLERATQRLLQSSSWTPLPRDPATDTPGSMCTILASDAAESLARRMGGDIEDGRAIVELGSFPHWSLTGLMPDGEPGAHGD